MPIVYPFNDQINNGLCPFQMTRVIVSLDGNHNGNGGEWTSVVLQLLVYCELSMAILNPFTTTMV